MRCRMECTNHLVIGQEIAVLDPNRPQLLLGDELEGQRSLLVHFQVFELDDLVLNIHACDSRP